MRILLRKAIKITGWSLGSVFAMLITFAGLLAFPGFLFAHQLDYRNITLHSDVELRGRIEPILAQVGAQLSASEINDPALQYDLYFAHDNAAFRVLDHARWAIVKPLTGLWPSPNYATGWPPRINQVVCLDAPDPENDLFRRDDWRSQLNMTHVLTHESGHLLVMNKLGIIEAMNLPMWKAEGYPEYVASHFARTAAGYSLRASVTRVLTANLAGFLDERGDFLPLHHGMLGRSFLKDENGDDWHTGYYLARVLVEYSLDVKGMSFDQLVATDVRDTDLMRELLADYAAGRF